MNTPDSDRSEDKDLTIAIKQSDADAFKRLYYKYFEKLTRFAWIRTKSMDTAREFTQEVFFRIWIKRHLLNPDSEIKSYLYRALNNLIIDSRRLHSSRQRSINDINPKLNYNNTDNLDLKIDIEAAIEKLPEKLKSVFLLSRIEGFKYAEIAEICGISVKAVEKRMTSAIKSLRKLFK